jgi:hypothetical protein
MTPALTTASLRMAGGLLLLIGIGHMFMPEWGYAPSVVAGMTAVVEAHFYHLGTYAIGSFLMAFGIMSLVHARQPDSATTHAFTTVMGLVWVFRVALEFQYPVRLTIFVLHDPHPVLAPLLILIAGCFSVAAWGSWRALSSKRR